MARKKSLDLNKKQLEALLDKYGGWKAAADAEDLPLSALYNLAAQKGVSLDNSLPDKVEFQALLDHCGSWQEMGRFLDIAPSTLKSRGKRLGVKSPRSGPGAPKPTASEVAMKPTQDLPLAVEKSDFQENRKKGTAEGEYVDIIPATSDPHEMPDDPTLLKRANRDPETWEVTNLGYTVWDAQKDGEVFVMRSLRVSFGKIKAGEKLEQIFPSFEGRPLTIHQPKRRKSAKRDGTRLVAILSDFHAPFHDRDLLSATQQALLESQPDELIINGDIVDWPTLGGKPTNTRYCQATGNECIQAAGKILTDLKSSVPEDCKLIFIPGNHDAWLSRYLYHRAQAAGDICQADSDERVWSLPHLLRLEEKGYEMIGEEELWQQSTYALTDRLIVWHGDKIKQRSGASVIANMERSDFASITGHTHRQAAVSLTKYNAHRQHKILEGAETGGMYKMPEKPTDWPTYRAHNTLDWQPGWLSVTVEPDGHYGIDLASWQNGVLMWRGNRYEADRDDS